MVNPQPQPQRQQGLLDLAAAVSPWVDTLHQYTLESWETAFQLVQADMDYQREQHEFEEIGDEETEQENTYSAEAADDQSSGDLNASDNQQLHLSPVAPRADATQLPQQQCMLAPETSSRNSTAAGAQPLPLFPVTGGMFMPASAQQPQQQLPGPHQQQTAQHTGHQLAGQQRSDSLLPDRAWQTFQACQSAGVKAGTAEKDLSNAFSAEARLFQQGLDLVAERLVQTDSQQNILEDMLQHIRQDKELPTYIETSTADCSAEKTRLDAADTKWQQKQSQQISLTLAATKAYQAAAVLRSKSTEAYEAVVQTLDPSQQAPHLVPMYAGQQALSHQPIPVQSYQPVLAQSQFPLGSHFMGAPSQVSPWMLA